MSGSLIAKTVTEVRAPTSTRMSKRDRKSTRLNSSHSQISYAVFCLKKKKHDCQPLAHRHVRAAVAQSDQDQVHDLSSELDINDNHRPHTRHEPCNRQVGRFCAAPAS